MSTAPQGPTASSPIAGTDPTVPVPVGAAPHAASVGQAAAPGRPRRRWGDVAVASMLSAVLASGGTYAAVRAADGAGDGQAAEPVVTSSTGDAQGTPVSLTGEQDWASVAATVRPGVVSIDVVGQRGAGSGSGVVWDTVGHVVTNAHVVEGAQQLRVTLDDGRSYAATLVGSDPSSDLAVVRLEAVPQGLTPVRVGDDRDLAVGDEVMAVGNPLGLSGTVTTGIVSALDRPVTTQGGTGQELVPVVTNAIQTSAAINPGNSGGALVNPAGELVGINSSIASLPAAGQSQAGSIGIGFAIPATKVRLIADQLIESGRAEHAFLGVSLGDGTAEVDGAGLSGAEVQQVEPGTPAEQAGLQPGDLIVGIDEEPVPSSTALVGQVRERGSGQQAVLEYVRDGQRAEVTVTLSTRPDQP